MSCPRRQTGIGLLEVVFIVIIVGALMAIGLDRMLNLQADMERVKLQRNIDAMRGALALHGTELMLNRQDVELMALVGSNPVRLLLPASQRSFTQQAGGAQGELQAMAEGVPFGVAPPGYVGERKQLDPLALEPGQWAFDQTRGVLVYRVKHQEYFRSDLAGVARVELSIATHSDRARVGLEDLYLRGAKDFKWVY